MSDLFRFITFRPAQKLTKQSQSVIGTKLYDDGNPSSWAEDLEPFFLHNDHHELYNRIVDYLHSTAAISSYAELNSLSREMVELMQKKGRYITASDVNSAMTSTKLTPYFALTSTGGPSRYTVEKQAAEDTLSSLAFLGKLGNPKNVDVQLVFKATQIMLACYNNVGGISSGQLRELVEKPLILPQSRYNACMRKTEELTPYYYLDLSPLPESGMKETKQDETDCNCNCKESACQDQDTCCAELKPFVADLMLVREELKCYKPEHLAYIENIMVGEERTREHRNLERTETFTETETEINKSLEKDHQVEDRFSLKSQIEKTIEQDLSIDAGVTTTSILGSTQLDTNFSFSNDLSKSESQQQAQEYARNVVTRAVSKVEEKVRTLNSIRKISETEEKNSHKFNNIAGPKHIVGQYHFVNMVNKAQVMNYGKRLMFEFVLPEPMELYKKLLKKEVLPFDLEEPEKPLLQVLQIHPGPQINDTTLTDPYTDAFNNITYSPTGIYNYLELIKYYELTNIDPMPDADIYIPFSFENSQRVQSHNEVLGFSVPLGTIPAGYKGIEFCVDIKGYDYVNDAPDAGLQMELEWFIDGQHSGHIPVEGGGGFIHRTPQPPAQYTIDAVEGTALAMSVMCKSSVGINGSGWIKCVYTEQAKTKWKTTVWEKIIAKYLQNKQEYETARARYEQEKNAKLPFGNNPFINREVERTELKRLAISYTSCQFFDKFNAMKRNVEPCGYPEMNLREAQENGMFVQFFEQIFEWNLMTYLFYPYFWGQKCSWPEKIQTNSGDPLFDKALMAGAARVQVPVRPGMEALALHWVEYGEIWQGESTPPLPNSDYYLSMSQEIKEQKNCFYRDREGLLHTMVGSDVIELSDTAWYWDFVTGMINEANVLADINREIIINCEVYRIVEVYEGHYQTPFDPLSLLVTDSVDHLDWTIRIERVFEGTGCCGCDEPATNQEFDNLKYQTGALFVGAPFEVVVPTNLVFLRNMKDADGAPVFSDCLPCYPLDKC
jgi:hypothetical protein